MKIEHTLDRLARMKEQTELKEARAAKARLDKAKENLFNKIQPNVNAGTKVQISSKAKDLDRIKKIVQARDANSAEKISRLKKLIAEKKYEVPAEKVADKMVNEYLKTEVL